MPQSGSELLGIIIYTILLVVAVISNVGMLVMTVSLLKSVRFERLDAGLLLTEGVPDEKDTTAVRFIGRLYVQHTSKNNAVLEKGYTAFNRCVNAFCVSIVALIALAIISIFWDYKRKSNMPDREDMKSILEACRKTGPMDERLVRGTAESSPRNSEEYHADAMRGTNYLQFSYDGNENKGNDNE